MTRAIIASLLCGAAALAVASCGGKGSYSSGYSGGSYQSPSGNGQAPPSNNQAPPSSKQSPGMNPQGPGGSGGVFSCEAACSKLAASGCYPIDVSECTSECESEIPEDLNGPCGSEYLAFYNCLVGPGIVVCERDPETGQVDDFSIAGCEAEEQAVVDCASTGTGNCTPNDNCAGCSDNCSECVCLNGSVEMCANECSGGGTCDYGQGICTGCTEPCEICECTAGPGSMACDEACGRVGTGSCVAGVDCSACSVGSCEECLCLYDNDTVFCSEYCM